MLRRWVCLSVRGLSLEKSVDFWGVNAQKVVLAFSGAFSLGACKAWPLAIRGAPTLLGRRRTSDGE